MERGPLVAGSPWGGSRVLTRWAGPFPPHLHWRVSGGRPAGFWTSPVPPGRSKRCATARKPGGRDFGSFHLRPSSDLLGGT